MKKSLIALAILGGMSGVAMAQSSMTVYGIVDMGYNYNKSGDQTSHAIDSGLQSGSRLGFKGTEDLGNGLKANFVLESGLNADTGTYSQGGRAFGRQAWLGLEGGFGQVKLGRQYSPLRETMIAVDPFALGSAGSFGRTAFSGVFPALERVDNSVVYELPKNGLGLTGAAQYGFGESTDSVAKNRTVGFNVGYNFQGLNLGAAYSDLDVERMAKSKTYLLTATYDFGVAKAHAAYGENKVSFNGLGATEKTRNYMLGVSAPVSSVGTVKASYVMNDQRSVADADSHQFALGYEHSLSKRTNLYTTVAHINNDSNAQLGGAATLGKNITTYQVGMRHAF